MKVVTSHAPAASLVLLAAFAAGASAGAAAGAAAGGASLYDRLGGEAGVAVIADELIDRVSADPRLGRSFKDTNVDRIKRLLAEQICDLAGGPCKYSGDSMKEVHAGHHISEAEFYGMVAELRVVLKQRHVSLGATNELLRLLAPMKRDVVEPAQTAAQLATQPAAPSAVR
jgi:hemoglobin